MAIYLKLTPEVKGEATAEKAKGYIVLTSFQFGVGVGVSMAVGSGNRETSLPSLSEITVTKGTDVASTSLFESVCLRKNYTSAEIIFTTMTGEGKEETFLKYDLANVIFSGYSVSSGGDRPSESLSLNYTKVTVQYQLDENNKLKSDSPIKSWDLSKNTA
ncbi:MAG: type VI secretion system tube protein Hcp [Gemmatimonadaceae bacterium]|nr:type VI secretion system tube protein Hcp [Gemmatimonadaceae bacterium]